MPISRRAALAAFVFAAALPLHKATAQTGRSNMTAPTTTASGLQIIDTTPGTGASTGATAPGGVMADTGADVAPWVPGTPAPVALGGVFVARRRHLAREV